MKHLTEKEFKKFEYLIGFVNQVCDIVSNPEEHNNPSCKGSSVYSLWYAEDNDSNKVSIETCDCESSVSEIRSILNDLIEMVRENSKIDHTKEWRKLKI